MYRKLGFTILSCAAICVGATQALAETVTLRFASWFPAQHPINVEVFEKWISDVDRLTSGRVKIEMLKTPLGPPAAHFDLVKDGVADISYSVHDSQPNRFVLNGLAQLPFRTTNAEISSTALWRTHEKFFAEKNEHEGLKVLALMVHGPGQLYTIAKPVKSVADFKSLKIRASTTIQNEVLSLVGASPVTAPAPKSYEVVSNGVVDGTLFPVESVVTYKLTQFIKYETKVPGGLYTATFGIFMNEAKWNSISEEDREKIWSVSGEALSRKAGAAWDASDTAARSAIEKAGITTIEPDPQFVAELESLFAPIAASWAERASKSGVDVKAAAEFYRAEVEKLSAE